MAWLTREDGTRVYVHRKVKTRLVGSRTAKTDLKWSRVYVPISRPKCKITTDNLFAPPDDEPEADFVHLPEMNT